MRRWEGRGSWQAGFCGGSKVRRETIGKRGDRVQLALSIWCEGGRESVALLRCVSRVSERGRERERDEGILGSHVIPFLWRAYIFVWSRVAIAPHTNYSWRCPSWIKLLRDSCIPGLFFSSHFPRHARAMSHYPPTPPQHIQIVFKEKWAWGGFIYLFSK